jgi:CheY-like chemotaxis protein
MTAPATGPILLVEDDGILREMLSLMLTTRGYSVVGAGDCGEAIQLLDEQPAESGFSLVLLDMMLPVMDGLQVLNHMSKQGSSVPVVAMSADYRLLTAAEQAGAQAILSKPFDMLALLGVVEQQLVR